MTKERYGSDCKVCLKPYCTYRWWPSADSRVRQTVLCYTCAKAKNLCQGCILDVDYSIPVSIRNSILNVKNETPKQHANREFLLASTARSVLNQSSFAELGNFDDETIQKMNNAGTQYHQISSKNNQRLICSFYAKGKCNRGEKCPYRHTLEISTPQTLQAFRDKYYGSEKGS